MSTVNYIRKEWGRYVKQTAIISLFAGSLIACIGILLSKANLSHLPTVLVVGLGASVVIFLLYFVTTILPNYIFYRKLLRSNREKYIADNIDKYGIHFLLKNLWFIWPREFDEKYQRKARESKKGSE